MNQDIKWIPEGDQGVIFSAQTESLNMALNEIYQAVSGATFGTWLGKGAGAVNVPGGFAMLSKVMRRRPPIFLRHLFPVQQVVNLEDEKLEDALAPMVASLQRGKAFSVQARGKDASDLGKALAEHIVSLGYEQDVRFPEQIISVYIDGDIAYCGLSTPENNLSIWSGGVNRYSREGLFISRAQFKLVEAFETFNLRPVKRGRALDLGAAPGGWTMVLCDMGYRVWAVDPAPLHPDIMHRKSVHYVKGTAQQFHRDSDQRFDLLVNDMIIDARESALLMNRFAERLTDQGQAIMTIKLPRKDTVKRMKSAIKLLEREYVIEGVRQLSQNKSEVTCLMKKR